MLWFNSYWMILIIGLITISIHLMLWFNLAETTFFETSFSNFNTSYVVVQLIPRCKDASRKSYFNTSYVVVQQNAYLDMAYKECYFNTSYVVVQQLHKCGCQKLVIFQYILCCGSTQNQTHQRTYPDHFNTSYVVVQQLAPKLIRRAAKNFNTSYVVVQHSKSLHECIEVYHFNTSYVVVQR